MNTALRFCYELQGFAEIGNEMPAREQWEVIVNKLNEISIDHLIIETDCLMAQEAFVIWLKGYVDISNPLYVNEQQWQIIKDHLQLVFTKVTPSYEDEDDETENIPHWCPLPDASEIHISASNRIDGLFNSPN